MAEPNQASPSPFTAEGSPSLQQLVDYGIERLFDPANLKRLEATHSNATASGITIAENAALQGLSAVVKVVFEIVGVPLLESLFAVLKTTEPATEGIAKIALDSVLGEGVKRAGVPAGIGQKILDKLAPATASVEPSIAGAVGYMDLMVGIQMEAWLLGLVAEVFGESLDVVRGAGGAIESVAELREVITQIFGGGRITRRVLAPFIDDGIVQPAKRWTARKYRPQLLGVSEAVRAYMRGDWEFDRLDEESSQQGWSDERLQLLVENARKRLTIDELIFRHFRGEISDVETAQLARALEYDEATTLAKIAIEDAKRIDALNAPVISEAVSNYIAGDVDDRDLERWVNGAAPNATDAGRMISTAKARRAINVKHIASTRMRALVLEGIANVNDYTDALARENYIPEHITLEELSLRADLAKANKKPKRDASLADLEKLVLAGKSSVNDFQATPAFRALTADAQASELQLLQVKIDKQADDEAKAAAAAADKAAREAAIAEKRSRVYPTLSEYRTAYVRGYIDRSTYAAALAREKVVDADASFLLAGADGEREQWLADQAKRTQALAAAEHKGLSLAEREQAVLEGIVTLPEFDSSLVKDKLVDADRAVLVKLLQAKLDDQAAAKAKRDEAAARAAEKNISLATWEQAVTLGVRSLDDYSAFLQTLPLNDAARALVVDTLRAKLAAADEAKATRAARDAAAAAKGISLAQRRRTVIAGVRPRTYYADALQAAGWPVDDQLADLDLLDTEIAAAADARDKAAAVTAKLAPSVVSIGQLSKALTLGLVTPTEFEDAVAARGASDADVQLLEQLAVAGVQDARAGQQLHDQVTADLAAKGVSLADLENGVRRGLVTLDAFGADLARRGYGADAVDLLTQLLQDKLDVDVDGLTRKISGALAKAPDAPTLEELAQQLGAGALDAASFQAALVDAGAPADAALVYARLVVSGEVGA